MALMPSVNSLGTSGASGSIGVISDSIGAIGQSGDDAVACGHLALAGLREKNRQNHFYTCLEKVRIES